MVHFLVVFWGVLEVVNNFKRPFGTLINLKGNRSQTSRSGATGWTRVGSPQPAMGVAGYSGTSALLFDHFVPDRDISVVR